MKAVISISEWLFMATSTLPFTFSGKGMKQAATASPVINKAIIGRHLPAAPRMHFAGPAGEASDADGLRPGAAKRCRADAAAFADAESSRHGGNSR